MTLLFNTSSAFLISHSEYISQIFKSVKVENESHHYLLSPKIFAIKNKMHEINNKRPRKCDEVLKETGIIRELYQTFLTKIPEGMRENIFQDDYETAEVREHSKRLFELTQFDYNGLKGGNNSDDALKCLIKDEYFLIPPKSRFLCGCVKEQSKGLAGNKYDIVIADPPWWNKYIRRLKSANNKMRLTAKVY
ncbi:uncharacterized protein LOC121737089 isoform X2 [Aricia agestis]|uniref:uncharacterized protein LOC121737089 isoform X2 n=1 Tax=Aricia agestis TaxID=91739 RepID=UPI001C204D8E|nr:uncharacterized protein LOC121737089 isoform X2 [Aricia agestis]